MAHSFSVSDVARNVAIASSLSNPKIEAVSSCPHPIVATEEHAFLGALRLAFSQHLPLVLRPDDVWQVLVQGLATHVSQYPERLRSRLVDHDGTPNLIVRRNDFRRHDTHNDWPSVVLEFSRQIHDHTGKRHQLIVRVLDAATQVELQIRLGIWLAVLEPKRFDQYAHAALAESHCLTKASSPGQAAPDPWTCS